MKKHYRFSIVIEQDKDGFFAFCPELQGCYTQGDSYENTLENIKDAIHLHLEDRVSSKEELPRVQSVSLSTVDVAI